MVEKKELEIRRIKKKKQPRFIRHASWRKPRLKNSSWKRPRGIHSKARHQKKGNVALVKPGYRSPKSVRGLSKRGFVMVRVANLNDLRKIDPVKEIAIVASTSIKNREIILKYAREKGIKVQNFDIDKELQRLKEIVEKKREERKKIKEKQKSLEEKIKKEEEKKEVVKEEEKKTEEEKKKEMEAEKMKILTKKEV